MKPILKFYPDGSIISRLSEYKYFPIRCYEWYLSARMFNHHPPHFSLYDLERVSK